MTQFNIKTVKDIVAQAKQAQTKDGVYIQDINGKLWKTEDWDGSVVPNAIAVIAKEAKFLIALAQSVLQVSDSGKTEFDRYMFSTSCHELALTDNDGQEIRQECLMPN